MEKQTSRMGKFLHLLLKLKLTDTLHSASREYIWEKVIEDIRLEVKDGLIVKATAKSGEKYFKGNSQNR